MTQHKSQIKERQRIRVKEPSNYYVVMHNDDISRAFFGESMFSLVPSASKLALIYLAEVFEKGGGAFIDCQFETPHLLTMGGCHIHYDEYMKILREE